MSELRKKVKRFVIDINCFLSIFINRELDWLVNYVHTNKLEIFTDTPLIEELFRTLHYRHIRALLPLDPIVYVQFVQSISTFVQAKEFIINSPDPDDDYLYVLTLSANAKLLVTGEKALLNWKDSPVKTLSLSAFKKLF